MNSRDAFPYTILGGGAIGGSLAVALLEAGVPVQIVDADAEHVAAVRKNGMRITSDDGDRVAWVPIFGLDDAPQRMQGVLLAVKAQATERALDWLQPRLADNGFVASMQNGLNESTIASRVGAHRTVACFVDLFADVMEPGVIKDGGPGAMSLGEYDGDANSPRVLKLANDLRLAGKPVVTDNVTGFLWSKLAFGTMSCVTGLADDEMYNLVDRHRPAMYALMAEVIKVATALGIELESFDAFTVDHYGADADASAREKATDEVVAWLRTQPKTRSGIWRDLHVRRRPTEVASHYLPVLEQAAEYGYELPFITEMLKLIGQMERGEIVMDEEHLSALDRRALATDSSIPSP